MKPDTSQQEGHDTLLSPADCTARYLGVRSYFAAAQLKAQLLARVDRESLDPFELAAVEEFEEIHRIITHSEGEPLLCCRACGSSSIQAQSWTLVNSGLILDDTERYWWCNDCEDDGRDAEMRYCDAIEIDRKYTRDALGFAIDWDEALEQGPESHQWEKVVRHFAPDVAWSDLGRKRWYAEALQRNIPQEVAESSGLGYLEA